MKRTLLYNLPLFLFIGFGCVSLKISVSEIQYSTYVCDKGNMVGNTTIVFEDSTFFYTERGGLFKGKGKWELLPDGKTLELKGMMEAVGGDLNLTKEISFNLLVKGKDKLIGDGCVFTKKE